MRSIGYPRPSCKECRGVVLSRLNIAAWNLYNEWWEVLFNFDGMSGTSTIDIEGVKFLCDELPIRGRLEFVKKLKLINRIVNKTESEDEDEKEKGDSDDEE